MPTRQGCSFSKERQDVATLQLTADDHFAIVINAVDLKYRFGNAETDCRDRLHDLAPPNRGALTAPTSMALNVPVVSHGPVGLNGLVKQRFREGDEPYLHLYPHSSSGGPGMPFQGRGHAHLCLRQRRTRQRPRYRKGTIGGGIRPAAGGINGFLGS
jgi:hypothetical protein